MINHLQLPSYQPGPSADWSPIHNALESNQRQQNYLAEHSLRQKQFGLAERADLRAGQMHGLQLEQMERQKDLEEARMVDGRVRYIQGLPLEQQGPAWKAARQQKGFRDLPPEFDDFNYAAPLLRGRAAEYIGEKDQAEIDFKRAQASKLHSEARDGGQGKAFQTFQAADGKFYAVQAAASGPPRVYPLDLGTAGGSPGSAPRPISPPIGQPGASPYSQAIPLPHVAPPPPINHFSGSPGPAGAPQNGAGPYAVAPSAPIPRPNQVNPAAPPPGQAYAPRYVNPPGMGLDQRSANLPGSGAQPPSPYPSAAPPQPLTPFRGTKQVGRDMVDLATGRVVGTVEDSVRGGKFAEEDAKAAVADIKSRNDAIQASRSKLPRLEIMEQLIARADVYQGTGGNAVLELRKAAQALGFDVGDLSGSEAVRMISNQFALALRNPAGGEGMPGALSDRDLAFLVSSTPGLSNTRQGNALMVRVMIELERFKMRENAEAAKYMQGRKSTAGLAEHMQEWAQRNSALTDQTRKRITGLTGIQYGVTSGPVSGSGTQKQYGGRLNEPEAGSPSPRGVSSFASPGIAGNMPSIRNDADYEALPSGSAFVAPDGSWRRKP